ncbi:hypothetical protein [Streptomyces sp. NPDC059743]|uniref:hypothetical protein n=1 Tax=Streptomyces sp. NPDC059743 TaxID=3346928 RepID=UPI003664B602
MIDLDDELLADVARPSARSPEKETANTPGTISNTFTREICGIGRDHCDTLLRQARTGSILCRFGSLAPR